MIDRRALDATLLQRLQQVARWLSCSGDRWTAGVVGILERVPRMRNIGFPVAGFHRLG
jgi:hypothetical protein